MEDSTLAERLSDLASRAESIAEEIQAAGDEVPERTRRHAHRLREVLGVALILSDRLARRAGNDRMVLLEDRGDGTGEARFTVALDESSIAEIRPQ